MFFGKRVRISARRIRKTAQVPRCSETEPGRRGSARRFGRTEFRQHRLVGPRQPLVRVERDGLMVSLERDEVVSVGPRRSVHPGR